LFDTRVRGEFHDDAHHLHYYERRHGTYADESMRREGSWL
jgi:hypothetical protein